jgi:hypothetical protein
MIVLGVVVVSLNQKQHEAVEELEESTYSRQARYLANAYAKYAVSEVVARKKAGTDILTCTLLKEFKNVKDIANSHIRVYVSRDTLKGEAIEIDDYAITSVSHVEASYGASYIARTNILFKYGADFTPPPDIPQPIELTSGAGPGQNLLIRLLPTGVYHDIVPNSSDHNLFHFNEFQASSTLPSGSIISMDKLEKAAFNVRLRGPITGTGVRLAVHNTPIPYSINFYIEGNIVIEGNLRTVSASDKIRIFAEGNIYWANRHNSPNSSNPLIYTINADLFAVGQITQAGGLMNGNAVPLNTIQIKANYVNAYVNSYGLPSGSLNNSTYNLTGQGNLYSNLSRADLITLYKLYEFDEEEEDPDDLDGSGDDDSSGSAYYMVGIRSLEEHPVQIVRQ